MEKALRVINELEKEGIIEGYALGGATALLFYTEPALTFDIDVFLFLPEGRNKHGLVDLSGIYKVLRTRGYRADKEHILIEGIPVQFIPVYNPLIEEAVKQAVAKEYKGVKTRVLTLEHLLAIMLDTDRPKDRERIGNLLNEAGVNRGRLTEILKRHNLNEKWRKKIEKK